jgi:hypothetical protein
LARTDALTCPTSSIFASDRVPVQMLRNSWRMLESALSPLSHVARRRPSTIGTPSFFTMSNSPPRDLSTQPVSFPRRVCTSGLLRPSRFISPHPSCRYRFGERARRNLGDSITSDPEMRGPAERREAYYLSLSRL